MNIHAGVPSPCINVCRMNPRTGWCDGCLRRIDEITDWALLSDAEKLAVWQELAQRRARLPGGATAVATWAAPPAGAAAASPKTSSATQPGPTPTVLRRRPAP